MIHPSEIGLWAKNYNPKVHGPYCQWRYYGKRGLICFAIRHEIFLEDTKLMDVKISELPAWIGRRDKSIGAIYNETMRNVWRVHYLYYSGESFL